MPTLNVNGKRVKVSDDFMQLSPEDQQATVEQIAASMKQQPRQGGNILDPIAQGATFGFMDEIKGVDAAINNKIKGIFGAGTDEKFGETYKRVRDEYRDRKDAFAERNPKTAIGAEISGGLLTGGAGAIRAGATTAGRQWLARLIAIGAAEGGLYGAGASDADTVGGVAADMAVGTGIGAAGGALIPMAARAVGNKLRSAGSKLSDDPVLKTNVEATQAASNRLDDEAVDSIANSTRSNNQKYQDSVSALRDSGVTLTTGQRTGSAGVKNLETTIDKTLWGGAVDKTFRRQKEQLQSNLMRMAGFPEDVASTGRIDGDTLEAAGREFSRRYSEALRGKTVELGDSFVDDLDNILQKHNRLLTPQRRKEIVDLSNDFLDEAVSEPMTGERYQRLRSFLGKRARENENKPQIAELFRDYQEALDNVFIREGVDNRDLNAQYANYQQLRNVWRRNGGAAVAQGEVPIASLYSQSKRSPASREFQQMLEAASAVMGDTANSGTASRLANLQGVKKVGDLMTGGVPTLILNQALARGVGGGVPGGAGRLLGASGRGVNSAGAFVGAVGGPASIPMLPPASESMARYLAEQDAQKRRQMMTYSPQ